MTDKNQGDQEQNLQIQANRPRLFQHLKRRKKVFGVALSVCGLAVLFQNCGGGSGFSLLESGETAPINATSNSTTNSAWTVTSTLTPTPTQQVSSNAVQIPNVSIPTLVMFVMPPSVTLPSSSTAASSEMTTAVPVSVMTSGEVAETYLDRIKSGHSKNQYFALRAQVSGQFASVQEDGILKVNSSRLTQSALFELVRIDSKHFYLKSAGNGKFVSAENAGLESLRANRLYPSAWENFEVVEISGDQLAIRAGANGKFVSAEQAGQGSLFANRDSSNLWETFKLMPVIDMAQVITAFADRHPNEAKMKTGASNTGTAYYNNQGVLERRISGKQELIKTQISHDGVRIHDWIWLASESVGLHGTFPMYPGGDVHILDPMVPYSNRFLTAESKGSGIGGNFKYLQGAYGSPDFKNIGEGSLPNVISFIGMRHIGGTIGSRWVITVTTDLNALPKSIAESFSYDLGPIEGVYDPEFGWLGYDQANKPGGGLTAESYGKVVPLEEHGDYYQYFKF